MGEYFVVEIVDVEATIEREIAAGCTQRQVAKTYALGIMSSYPTDWARVNAAIMKRWPKGLLRVKRLAWQGGQDVPETNFGNMNAKGGA